MSIKTPESLSSKTAHPRKPSRLATALKVLGVLLVVCIAGYVGYFLARMGSGARGMIGPMVAPPSIAQEFPGQSSINLMIIGRDYDYTNQDVVMKSHARADLLMMAKLDFADNQVKILSIPRDTKASIPGWPDSKINSAEEKGGPKLTAATVLQNFNIPEDHYVALDFDGFQKAIDLLGGVDHTVDKKMDYDDNWGFLHIHLKPGYQHLNGYNAMGFVRFRHSDSDIRRTRRQQALLAALKIKLDQPHTFIVLPDLINVMNESSETDLTNPQKIAVAYWLHSLSKQDFQMDTVPSIEGGYYVYTDWPKAAPTIKSWFGVNPPAGVSIAVPVVPTVASAHHHHHATPAG